ncbi:MAG: DUF4115 domain-containing protein [Deltaproteobacteria bacterium]|nr:DUF4115 domain-containing protein [Deltaproteobacteria bacterium]
MSDIKQDEPRNSEFEPLKELGLGALLKDERKKKGLSLDEVAKITRLRRHYLDALDNEDWDNLPAPVFIKGFIKSYAQTLGLDERNALDLYEKLTPIEEEAPKPLVEPKKSRSRGVFLVISLLVIVMAVTVYLWTGQQAPVPDNRENLLESREEVGGQPSTLKIEEPEPVEEQFSGPIEQEPDAESSKADKPAGADKPQELQVAQRPLPPVVEEIAPDYPSSEPAAAVDRLVLTGIVNMRTYIKIYIDDMLPKEYIFHPGSRPQWEAREGFDILVGNAAGIEFDINGKRIKDLGGLGKVVRVRFPEDFESNIYED